MIWDSSRPIAWWVTWDGRQADYWGGASPGSGKCACGETDIRPNMKRSKNNTPIFMEGNNDQTWREDSGYLTYKNDLPVTQLMFGDTSEYSGRNEEGYHTLGKLICYP
ncbi:hypothetical protein Bbelb_416530 [Branchiostoma belcheri]|nr:hypothetical protein Bbelb_416530 [Branchiostoma belcheri]